MTTLTRPRDANIIGPTPLTSRPIETPGMPAGREHVEEFWNNVRRGCKRPRPALVAFREPPRGAVVGEC